MSDSSTMHGKRRRWPWIALGALVLLVLVGALALPLLLDPERYRGRIERALEETTGWDVELGSIDVSVFGGLALRVSPARLAAPGEGSSISIEALSVDASLLPLLRGELEVTSIELIEPTIELVRDSVEKGWSLPATGARAEQGPEDEASADAGDGSGESASSVSIARVDISEGRARLVDRSGPKVKTVGLDDLDLTLLPAELKLDGRGRLEGDAKGRILLSASPEQGWRVELEGVDSGSLGFFVDESLMRGGGRISGSIEATSLARVEGRLRGTALPLLAGEVPLDSLDVTFVLAASSGAWSLDEMQLEAGALKMSGRGTILPSVALDLVLARTELDPALETLKAFFPLPLELKGPGWLESRASLRTRGDAIVYSAKGSATAARFIAGGPLPPVEDVEARFAIDEAGTLRIDIDGGNAAEGPLRGVARVTPVYPPGTLTFEGRLDDASMGGLLAGFVGEKARTIRGPTSLTTTMTVDLSGAELTPAALGGKLSLRSVDVSLPGWDLEGALYRKLDEKLEGLGALRGLVEGEIGKRTSLESDARPAGDDRLVDLLGSDLVFSGPPWALEGLSVNAGDVKAEGRGSFDPATGDVKLKLTARLSEDATARLVKKEKSLKALVARDGRLTVPLALDGPLTSPKIGVEVGDLLKGEGTQDALEGLVEGLFKKRDKKKK